MNGIKRASQYGLILVCAVSFADRAGSQETAPEVKSDEYVMSRRIADLRAEVEALSAETEAGKREAQSRIDGLLARRAELEAELRRERGRGKQLDAKLHLLSEQVARQSSPTQRDRQRVLTWIADWRASVMESLPVAVSDRLRELDRVEAALKSESVSIDTAVVDLWKWVAREIERASEVRIAVQPLTISDKLVNAEVLSIGTVSMLFMTPEGAVGVMERSGGQSVWSPRLASGAEEKLLQKAFQTVRNQNGLGLVQLPATLLPASKKSNGTAVTQRETL